MTKGSAEPEAGPEVDPSLIEAIVPRPDRSRSESEAISAIAGSDTSVANKKPTHLFSRILKQNNNTTGMVTEHQIITDVRNKIKDIIRNQQAEENQGELARITNLLPNAYLLVESGRLKNLLLALEAFHADQPNLVYTSAVRSDCELAVLRSQRGMFRFVYRLSGSTPISATLSGLIFSALGMLIVAACIGWLSRFFFFDGAKPQLLSIPWGLVNLMLALAAIGSFVSILTRLNQLTSNRGYDAFLVFATGFFKPWIGIAFATFLIFVLNAHLINLGAFVSDKTGNAAETQSLYCVVAFISGFSERLVSDFITRTGNAVLGAPTATSSKAEAPAR